jgi:hypothetical protein
METCYIVNSKVSQVTNLPACRRRCENCKKAGYLTNLRGTCPFCNEFTTVSFREFKLCTKCKIPFTKGCIHYQSPNDLDRSDLYYARVISSFSFGMSKTKYRGSPKLMIHLQEKDELVIGWRKAQLDEIARDLRVESMCCLCPNRRLNCDEKVNPRDCACFDQPCACCFGTQTRRTCEFETEDYCKHLQHKLDQMACSSVVAFRRKWAAGVLHRFAMYILYSPGTGVRYRLFKENFDENKEVQSKKC